MSQNTQPNSSEPPGVKETNCKRFKERTVLKRFIFIERGLSYASLVRLLHQRGVPTTRQYLYMIVTGRLTPSYEFALKLCDCLGVKVFTVFDPSELRIPGLEGSA